MYNLSAQYKTALVTQLHKDSLASGGGSPTLINNAPGIV